MIRLKIFLKTHLPALYTLIRKATFLSYLFFRSQKIKKLGEKNIKAAGFGKYTVRFVTHLDFNDVMLKETVDALKSIS